MTERYDLIVVGGGIMGAAAALRARAGGMRVVVLESGDIGQGASGSNAGTLSLQIKRIALIPYALEGHAIWEGMGDAVGFRKTGGYTLAFTDQEADLLHDRMSRKRDAGAPISFVSPAEVAAREPGLSRRVVAASFCAEDGYANSSLTGRYYRLALASAGVDVRERCRVEAIDKGGAGFVVRAGDSTHHGTRLLLACGGWLRQTAAMIGIALPIRARVNTVSVLERGPPLVSAIVGHATGLLTLKQKQNGTVLVGGGWQGRGSPEDGTGRVVLDTVLPNLRLAQYAVPGLAQRRVLRCWTGFEANVPDFYPLAGALPGHPGAFVLGCVRGGYTIGPYIGTLMGDLILGREPAMPLFDPGRSFEGTSTS